jgi:predicted acylesterase/phospholipase RssA
MEPLRTGSAAPQPPRQGIVLSGGGAKAAYEVGVLKALFSGMSPATAYKPLVPNICAGTSAGAFNAAYLVSQLDTQGLAAIGNLEAVWLERLSGRGGLSSENGVYRFRGDPVSFLDPARYTPNPLEPFFDLARDSASLFWDGLNRAVYFATQAQGDVRQRLIELVDLSSFISVEPFGQTVREVINFESLRRCGTKVRVATTNWTTGESQFFTNPEMTDRQGPLAVLASAAMPGIFPPVFIGAEPHVDGGILMNTPLRLVTHHAETIHVIYLDPAVRAVPLAALQSTVSAMYRQQMISWTKTLNDDVEDARAINDGLLLMERVQRGESLEDLDPERLTWALRKIWDSAKRRFPYRLLTVHLYHPRDDLGGGVAGLLNLDRDHIEELIRQGFEDGVAHNCEASRCILPAGVEGVPAASPSRRA